MEAGQGEYDEQIAALRARIRRAEELGGADRAAISIARAVHDALSLDAELQRAQIANYKRLLNLVELANLSKEGLNERAAAVAPRIRPALNGKEARTGHGEGRVDVGAMSGRRRTTAGRLIRRTLWTVFLILPIATAVVLALNQSWSGDTARDAPREAGSPSRVGETARGAAAAPDVARKLAWRDEFNGPRCPSQTRWGFERGFVRNGELQWYQPENAFCRHGVLVIEARRASKPNPDYRASSTNWRLNRRSAAYTSASLMSRHRFTYGRVEVRARLDPRRGSWPALWTLGTEYRREPTSWPATGEIDIMEYYRRTLLANVCKPKRTRCAWSSARLSLSKLGGRGWANRFHTWAMDWSAQRIDLYLDGKLVNHVAVADAVGKGHQNPYVNKPAFLLLSQAIGGANGGDPTSTNFPVRLEVDYVRIYELNDRDGHHADSDGAGPGKE